MDFGGDFLQTKKCAIFVAAGLLVAFWLDPLPVCAGKGLSLLGKSASQTSTVGSVTGALLSADLATDGDTSTSFYSDSCTHTEGEVHPWWKVDLGETHCLGKVTLVNRGDAVYQRLTGAVVRAGLNADLFQNAVCGSPVTPTQAAIPGGHLYFICDPPVTARYVSVDIDPSRPGVVLESGVLYLTLCEVMVEECPRKTNNSTSCTFKLISEGRCVKNPRPLATIFINSLMACTFKCNRDDECWSFDYAPTTGRCRLYGEREEDLVSDSTELGCAVYAVVGCSVATHHHGLCNGSA